jgi:hypothetical protein
MAAPFEVSRHVNFNSQGPALFSGTVAVKALCEAWSSVQERTAWDDPLRKARHPQLPATSVVLLHESEVHTALLDDYDKNAEPVYDPRKASQLRRQLGKIVKNASEIHDVSPVTKVASITGLDGLTRIILPFNSPEGEALAVADPATNILWRERMNCLNVLQEVTGSKAKESFGPALMVARLPEETPEAVKVPLHGFVQTPISEIAIRGMDDNLSGKGFPLYWLAPPEVIG